MNRNAYLGTTICLLVVALAGASQAANDHAIINVMVDNNMPASPTGDQLRAAISDLFSIQSATSYKTADSEVRGLNWTLFLVNDASVGNRLFLAQVGLSSSIEFGISGNHSDEKLSEKSYDDQKAILEKAEKLVKAMKVCGTNVITVNGFKPQSFDQNENTYKALDEMGMVYDAGYQSGIIYVPGHENDVWPYKVDNHNFYAVPVSTATISGKKVPLDDRYIENNGISASQWYNLLAGKLDEVSGKDEPMVISLSTSISSKGDYFDAYKKFIGYALSKDAKFVNTIDLVEMARSGNHEATVSYMPSGSTGTTAKVTSECTTCGSSAKNISYSNGTITV